MSASSKRRRRARRGLERRVEFAGYLIAAISREREIKIATLLAYALSAEEPRYRVRITGEEIFRAQVRAYRAGVGPTPNPHAAFEAARRLESGA